jgi:hypothetical protein
MAPAEALGTTGAEGAVSAALPCAAGDATPRGAALFADADELIPGVGGEDTGCASATAQKQKPNSIAATNAQPW